MNEFIYLIENFYLKNRVINYLYIYDKMFYFYKKVLC